MNKLDEARTKIERIDKEMAKLFEERMNAVKSVLEYKIENNLPVFDSKREELLIIKNKEYVSKELESYYVEFLKDMMKVSKKYQEANYE